MNEFSFDTSSGQILEFVEWSPPFYQLYPVTTSIICTLIILVVYHLWRKP